MIIPTVIQRKMNCFKCGKETDRSLEQFNSLSMRRCSKCVFLCITTSCKKKVFRNGCCSSHVIIINLKSERYKGKCVTATDIERREKMGAIEEDYHNRLDQQRALIDYQRQIIATKDCEGGRRFLKKLEDNLASTIEIHDQKIDQDLKSVKEVMVTAFKVNLELMFANGEYLSGYKTEYQNYRGKFKEYKKHFDQHRQQKWSQERRKAERTKRRDSERKNRNSERSEGDFSGSRNRNHYTDDDSDDEPDLEDDETYFERTGGYKFLVKAFTVLEIEMIMDHDEIRKAYKKMCLKMHPDKHHGEEEIYKVKFFEVRSAYELIMTKFFPNINL